MNRDLNCPICKSEALNRYSHWTANYERGMTEEKRIQCIACKCEAPEDVWNNRPKCN